MKILLDKIMHEKNLTTRQAEILTGIPRSTISDIMIGKTMPRMDIMEQLAAGLKVSINDLFESPYQ
ncbi:MAG: helix-turn-helix transcriptional regulator [Dorea sp.]|nr:helix-turn-helix transcriptional regulator [Dorea sp.]